MTPISEAKLEKIIKDLKIVDINTATIRQICALSAALEKESGSEFVHLELGNPGIMAETIGIEAEKEAMSKGIANKYPDINGLPKLKEAASKFIKAFLNLDIPAKYIVPTVGSMQASYTLMTILKMRVPGKDTILFFNPGFPAQRNQAKMVGLNIANFDIYDYRGERMKAKLEEILSSGNVTAMLYSNPNNPSWSNLTEEELKIIGEVATKYDVMVLEDLAYMGMDFRTDYSKPFEPPYIPTVGRYTDNYILLISASKIFSYAGQRVAFVAMSPAAYSRNYPEMEKFFEMSSFGDCYIYGVLYTASSGVTHSAQYAMAEMLSKATDGTLPFIEHTKEYGRRSGKMKKIFLDNGFHIVYDKDGKENISDGFFFTLGYKDLTGEELQKALLRYGVSSISLKCTGSDKEGIRVCVSLMNNDDVFDKLENSIKSFNNDYAAKS